MNALVSTMLASTLSSAPLVGDWLGYSVGGIGSRLMAAVVAAYDRHATGADTAHNRPKTFTDL